MGINFYVIAGSVAGALIGLQFVVIALVANSGRGTSSGEIAAFGTPTVLHFCAALLLSGILSVPWDSPSGLQYTLLVCGVFGVLYGVIVMRRARRPVGYRPGLEDTVWHVVLPLVAYLTLVVGAVLWSRQPSVGLALVAGVTLGLVFIGIRNAWDTIAYIATNSEHGSKGSTGFGHENRRS